MELLLGNRESRDVGVVIRPHLVLAHPHPPADLAIQKPLDSDSTSQLGAEFLQLDAGSGEKVDEFRPSAVSETVTLDRRFHIAVGGNEPLPVGTLQQQPLVDQLAEKAQAVQLLLLWIRRDRAPDSVQLEHHRMAGEVGIRDALAIHRRRDPVARRAAAREESQRDGKGDAGPAGRS